MQPSQGTALVVMLLLPAGLIASSGCKDKSSPPAEPGDTLEGTKAASDNRPPTALGPFTAEHYGLSPGEALWFKGDDRPAPPDEHDNDHRKRIAGRVVAWQPGPSQPVINLYVVRTADNRGVLRAMRGGERRDVQTFAVVPNAARPELEVKTFPAGTALFRYSPAADQLELSQNNAVLLAWDDQDKAVKVIKRWRGSRNHKAPRWMETGELKTGSGEFDKCAQVVNKMSRCAREPRFVRALFDDLNGVERHSAEQSFTSQARRWATPEGARSQCEQWAGNDYFDTQLNDPEKLNELVKDTQLDCALFGQELGDGGGLPQAVAERTTTGANAVR